MGLRSNFITHLFDTCQRGIMYDKFQCLNTGVPIQVSETAWKAVCTRRTGLLCEHIMFTLWSRIFYISFGAPCI